MQQVTSRKKKKKKTNEEHWSDSLETEQELPKASLQCKTLVSLSSSALIDSDVTGDREEKEASQSEGNALASTTGNVCGCVEETEKRNIPDPYENVDFEVRQASGFSAFEQQRMAQNSKCPEREIAKGNLEATEVSTTGSTVCRESDDQGEDMQANSANICFENDTHKLVTSKFEGGCEQESKEADQKQLVDGTCGSYCVDKEQVGDNTPKKKKKKKKKKGKKKKTGNGTTCDTSALAAGEL